MNKPVSKEVLKFIKSLPAKQQNQLLTKIIEIINDPINHGGLKLKGYDNYYRQDVGEYRICYTIVNKIISIDICDKRNDSAVYKKLSRSINR